MNHAVANERSVLVVDDDPDYLHFWVPAADPFVALTAPDPDTAVAIMDSERPATVIVDLHLGPRTAWGFELIDELRDVRPDVVAVIVSSFFPRGIEFKPQWNSVDLALTKEIPPSEILARVQQLRRTGVARKPAEPTSLSAFTDAHIADLVARCGGNISEAARKLGVARTTVRRRLRRAGDRS